MSRYAWMNNLPQAPHRDRSATVRVELEAEQLLTASVRERGRGEYPFYTERWMNLVSEREAALDEHVPADEGPAEDTGAAALARLVVDAQLTRRQRMVVRWLLQGLSQQQIAEMLGVSEASVTRLKQSAFERIRRAAQDS